MANAATIAPAAAAIAPANAERVDPARVIAFLAMCFGMFMAFLDIQVVSASLSEIQAGLAASSDEITWVQTVVFDGRSGRHPAVRLSVPRARHAHHVRHLRRRLHLRQPDVRHDLDHGPDDPVAGGAGLHRRRHGADGVCLRLHHLSALQTADHHADHRAGRDAGADHRPDRRRLSDRPGVMALAVLHQHRSRHHGDDRSDHADRLRQAGSLAVRPFRLGRPDFHGAVSGRARIRAGGRAALRLVRRPDHRHGRGRFRRAPR